MKRTELRNFAESLVASLEEVADKVASIEAIITGNDDTTADDYVETEDEDYVEEPVADEVEEEESVADEEPIEEEPVATEFSEKQYQKVKDFLAL